MRGRSKIKRMQRGQTIVAEREQAQTDSERLLAHKKAARRQTTSLVLVALIILVIGLGVHFGMRQLAHSEMQLETQQNVLQFTAQLIDENGSGQVSGRMKTYIAQLEQDLTDLGYTMTKVTLPLGMSRTLYIDVDGQETYFKVDLDRDTALVAEDMSRMIKYLWEQDLHPGYVDLRVPGRAYYL